MKKNRWALAAAAVLGSSRAFASDPTTADCLAASEASLKSGNEHHLRAERGQLLVCAANSCPSDIRKECTRRVDEVNVQIPTIIFEVKDTAGDDLSGVRVTMDREQLAERLEGTAISIDPGEHTFLFEVPGQPSTTKRFLIREAEKDRRERINLGGAAQRDRAATTTKEHGEDRASWSPSDSHGLGTQRILGLVSGGVGVVGLALGTVFGLKSISQHIDANEICPARQCADPRGVSASQDAIRAGNISTVAFVAGAALLGVGGALWLTASAPTTQIGLGPGTVQVRGTW